MPFSSRTYKPQRGAIVLILLAGFCLLPFLRLASFAHPYLDDFIFPLLVRQHGVWAHTVNMYLTWQGRFSASFITALHPLAWGGLDHVQPFVFGFIVAVAASVVFAGNALLQGHRLPWPTRFAAGSLVLIILLLMLPSPTEAFYWLLSGLFYMGGGTCCFILLGVVATLQADLQPIVRRGWWLLAAGLACLAPGFSEMISCFVLALVIVLFPTIWQRQLNVCWLALLALAVVASAVATLAPGNFVRQEGALPVPVLRALALASAALGYTLVSWVGNGLLLILTLLVLPTLQHLVSLPNIPLARLTQRAWFWPAWVLVGLLLSYVFSYLAVGGAPPSRARNLLFALFVIGWFMSIAGLLARRVRIGQLPLPSLPGYGRAILSGLFLLLILSDNNYKLQRDHIGAPNNSVTQAYQDWLSGDAARYDQEEEARYALIRRTLGDSVVLPPLSKQPITLVWWDISYNPQLWGNKAYAKFFAKRAIWVKPPDEK